MQHAPNLWPNPASYLARQQPDQPVLCLSPRVLQDTAARFLSGFGGTVTYAVKANPEAVVLDNLVAAGISAFDVASPAEMRAARAAHAGAVLHYNNPVRSPCEIAQGIAMGVASWSVDDAVELAKLDAVPRDCEVSVRFALSVPGAAYSFHDKFGATPDAAVALLRQVAESGWRPALCFHPGTQCEDPDAWAQFIHAAADIAARAGVRLARLNVGGGFAANRTGTAPDLNAAFAAIATAKEKAFGPNAPELVCEPGRAMVAEAFSLLARVKSLRADGKVYLNDGIYGGLAELRDMGLTRRVRVFDPAGRPRQGTPSPRVVFGPTCDSLDRLPDGLALPDDMADGDFVLFDGMGAYSAAINTGFNGYGLQSVVTVNALR